MKALSLTPRRAGFTLIELLVVVTIIALLFALVVGGFSYADRFSKTSATVRTMEAIKLALENYKTKFGEFPEPANPGTRISLANKSYDVAGGSMLYQALSGDGYDEIKLGVTPKGSPQSNGNAEDEEVDNITFTDMPKEIWAHRDGHYYMVDGFGHPFQYTKAVAIDPNDTSNEDQSVTINSNYDLWSYGSDEENSLSRSLETTTSEPLKKDSLKWIKNW